MRTICVFMGTQSGIGERYTQDVRDMAALLAKGKYNVVYGGGDFKAMGVFAQTFLENRSSEDVSLKGVNAKVFAQYASPISLQTAEEVFPTLSDRTKHMVDLSDYILAMPCGMEGFQEINTAISHLYEQQLQSQAEETKSLPKKPMILMNRDGFFDPTILQFQMAVCERRSPPRALDNIYAVNSPDSARQTFDAFNQKRPTMQASPILGMRL